MPGAACLSSQKLPLPLYFSFCCANRAARVSKEKQHPIVIASVPASWPGQILQGRLEGTFSAHGCEWHAVKFLTQKRLGDDNLIALPCAGPGNLVPTALIMG